MSNTADKPISAANLKAVLQEKSITGSSSTTWNSSDWNNISAYLDSGENYINNLGNTKSISISGYGDFSFALIGKNDSGYVFQSDKIIAARSMNSSNVTEGGWASTLMRKWLNETLLDAFPYDFKQNVKSTTVKYDVSTSGETSTCSDKLWLPSFQEVFGAGSYSNIKDGVEGTQFAYYANGASKIKYNTSGSASSWWLRSVSGSTNFWYGYGGNAGYSGASSSDGVAPCFCI